MPWFRIYDGMPNHPRWKLVARATGRPVTEVLCVVLCLLDHASHAEPRGRIDDVDVEAIAITIGMDDKPVSAILEALIARGWVQDGRIASWDERQPAREDNTAAARKRAQRDRDQVSRNVTLGHDDVTQCHARGEESRVEESRDSSRDDNVVGLDSLPRVRARAG